MRSDSTILVGQIGDNSPAWAMRNTRTSINEDLRTLGGRVRHISIKGNNFVDALSKEGHNWLEVWFPHSMAEIPAGVRLAGARDKRSIHLISDPGDYC